MTSCVNPHPGGVSEGEQLEKHYNHEQDDYEDCFFFIIMPICEICVKKKFKN